MITYINLLGPRLCRNITRTKGRRLGALVTGTSQSPCEFACRRPQPLAFIHPHTGPH